MKKIITGSLLLLFLSTSVQATLIGVQVSSIHLLDIFTFDVDTVTVTADSSDLMAGHNQNTYYTIDVNAANIYIEHTQPGWNSDYDFHGFTIFDLDDSSGLDLTSILVDTDMANWTNDRLAYNADQVWIQLTGGNFTELDSGYLNLTLSFGNTSNVPQSTSTVPEPMSMALLSVGLIGIGFNRRKRLQ